MSLQTDNHASTSSLIFYRPDALPDAQQRQSTEGKILKVLITSQNTAKAERVLVNKQRSR